MPRRLLIYGATGYTGRLIVEEALAYGMRPLLAGRSRHKVETLARALGLQGRSAPVTDAAALDALLADADVLLNAAGPFCETALPLARACIARGVHYLDVSGELASLRALVDLGEAAREREVMLLPAAGFDVVPSDCMAKSLVQDLPSASELVFAFSGLNHVSRGSAASVFEQYDELVTVRRSGRLTRVTPGALERSFDFGRGPVAATAITWGDVVCAYHSTGVPDITVYYEALPVVRAGLNLNRYWGWWLRLPAPKAWLKSLTSVLPEGPSARERALGRAVLICRASDAAGRSVEMRLETPEVYSFTAQSSVAIADRVLHGDLRAGFQTPASAYGAGFVLGLPGVRRLDSA